jgi:XTP/dITP diphosphohydrolase
MADILANSGFEILTLADFPGVDDDIEETGASFAENAELKARAAAEATGELCIADDGGLVIDALGGAPGLHSKRFLGPETPFSEKMARILEMMKDVPEPLWTCRFRCAVAICTPDGRLFQCEGTCEGLVAHELKGDFGFGYDPIVFIPEANRHMAELLPKEKHRLSHRGRALACAKPILDKLRVES